MKISKFFKAKKVSDRCQQYKNNYEKIIVLKHDFDVALENGVKSRNFEEAKRVKNELEKVLCNLEFDLKFKAWKTIELGTGLKTAYDFYRTLKRVGCEISGDAKYIMEMSEFTVLLEKIKFELVILSVAELGLPGVVTTEEIYKRAQEMGLELCPPEVGPQLRLQYKDQPKDEWLRVAMKPIKYSGSNPYVFGVGCDGGGLWLDAHYGRPGGVWDHKSRWVFVRKKL